MGWFTYGIWAAVCVAKIIALAATFLRPAYRRLISLRAYLILSLLGEAAEFVVLRWYGFSSLQYRYTYYAADLTITVLGFFVLAHLMELAFEQTSVQLPGFRSGAILLFTGAATISAALTFRDFGASLPRFSLELEQNLSFIGMLLTLLLSIAMNVIRLPGARFRRVVLAFGILYSSGAIIYAMLPFFDQFLHWSPLVPFSSLFGAGLLAYTLVGSDADVPVRGASEDLITARKPA